MPKEHTLEAIRVDFPVPPHVPKDRVVDLSWAISLGGGSNDLVDPYEPVGWLNGPDIPRILYTVTPGGGGGLSAGGGAWIVTHYEDIERVYTDDETFSNKGAAAFQALIGESFRSIPLGVDPPEHSLYRMFLMPHFSPARLKHLEP